MSEPIIALDIIKVFLDKDNYIKYKDLLNTDILDRQTYEILNGIGVFFKRNENMFQIDVDSFATWFTQFYKVKLSADERDLYQIIFSNIKSRPSGLETHAIIGELNLRAARQQIINSIHEGKELEEIESIFQKFRKEKSEENIIFPEGSESMLRHKDFEDGLRWRLDILNQKIHPLDLGVFGIIAGRPNTGKTSFLAGEATYMAQQLRDDEVILFMHNEGVSDRLKQRLYTSMCGRPWSDFRKAIEEGRFKSIDKAYTDRTDGIERIKICNIKGLSTSKIEGLIQSHNTKLVIIDMLDKVTPTKSQYSGSDNVARLTSVYLWGNDIASKYCPVLGASQISAQFDGEYRSKWPQMEDLAGSKTDKQGEATFQLMIGIWGKGNNIRYISTPKNKYGAGGDGFQYTCQLDHMLSIYKPL